VTVGTIFGRAVKLPVTAGARTDETRESFTPAA